MSQTIKAVQPYKTRLLQIFIVSLLVALLPGLIFAGTVTVEGTGPTKDAALQDALRNAVEQAVGVMIDSSTLTQNYTVVKDEIYSNSQGFVRDFKILSESRQGGAVVLSVEATVDTEPNSKLYSELQRLKIIDTMLRDPRIAVVIPETHISRAIPDPAGETAIIRKLTDAGFRRLVDPQRINQIRYSNAIKAIIRGDKNEAVNIATNLGVDYLIVGEAFSEYAGDVLNSGIKSCRARVEARLIKADTGEIITANGTHATGVDITESIAAKKALNNAGELMGDYMIEKLMAFASNPNKGLQLVVRVTSYSKVGVLEEQLKKVKGVSAVYLRDYSGNKAVFDLNYTGTPQTLANAMANFYNISVRVEEMGNNIVTAVIN